MGRGPHSVLPHSATNHIRVGLQAQELELPGSPAKSIAGHVTIVTMVASGDMDTWHGLVFFGDPPVFGLKGRWFRKINPRC